MGTSWLQVLPRQRAHAETLVNGMVLPTFRVLPLPHSLGITIIKLEIVFSVQGSHISVITEQQKPARQGC